MGSGGETETPSKAPKATAQEQPPAISPSPSTVYPEWSGFQAYSPIPSHGFFHSSMASSPQAHPYMWGPQHLMPPYGTPPPPYVMYPHGGIYAHPSMTPGSHPYSPYAIPSPNSNAEASGGMPSGVEMDGKSSEGKKRTPLKKSKGSLGSLNMITGKNNNEVGKTSGASANDAFSQSGDSGSEGSSEGSDANSQNDSQLKTGGGKEPFEVMGSQNGSTGRGSQNGGSHASSKTILNQSVPVMPLAATGAPAGVAGPTTTLNIGMDYWGAPTPSPIAAMPGMIPHAPSAGGMVSSALPGSRENIPSDLWLQDERELKRQKRKQSNRESARRSRLRKQAECEELAQRVDVLKDENTTLREELNHIRKEYEQLLSKNTSLKERLGEVPTGTENSDLGRNDQHPGVDDLEKPVATDAQARQSDHVQGGH